MSATSESARIALRSLGERDGIVSADTGLLHVEQLGPPAGEERIESGAGGGADRVNAECLGRVDGRRLIVPEQIHLRKDDAMRLLCELERIRFDLAAQLVVFRLPVDGVDRHQKGKHARALDVSQELKAESFALVRAFDDA